MISVNFRKDAATAMAHGDIRADFGEFGSVAMVNVPFVPKIIIERLRDGAQIPKYKNDGDSGMDVYAPEDILIYPQERKLIPLGIAMELPKHPFHDIGYRWELQARPRSGISAKTNLVVTLGTVDNTYRGELMIIAKNDMQRRYYLDVSRDIKYINSVTYAVENGGGAETLDGDFVSTRELYYHYRLVESPYEVTPPGTILIQKGDRIAQLVLNQVIRPLEIVEGVVSMDEHRGGGFGSTGVRDDG